MSHSCMDPCAVRSLSNTLGVSRHPSLREQSNTKEEQATSLLLPIQRQPDAYQKKSSLRARDKKQHWRQKTAKMPTRPESRKIGIRKAPIQKLQHQKEYQSFWDHQLSRRKKKLETKDRMQPKKQNRRAAQKIYALRPPTRGSTCQYVRGWASQMMRTSKCSTYQPPFYQNMYQSFFRAPRRLAGMVVYNAFTRNEREK